MCQGEEYEGVSVRVYKLLSQMDIYLGGHSNVLTSTVTCSSRRKKKTEVMDWRKREQA